VDDADHANQDRKRHPGRAHHERIMPVQGRYCTVVVPLALLAFDFHGRIALPHRRPWSEWTDMYRGARSAVDPSVVKQRAATRDEELATPECQREPAVGTNRRGARRQYRTARINRDHLRGIHRSRDRFDGRPRSPADDLQNAVHPLI
jgi:hypothetical protein